MNLVYFPAAHSSTANFLAQNFELLAEPYGSSKYFAEQDLEEFVKSLRLDSCDASSEALKTAAKWGVGTSEELNNTDPSKDADQFADFERGPA